MNVFIRYLKDYFGEIRLPGFLLTTVFVAALIALNYSFGIEKHFRAIAPWALSLVVFFLFYLFVFTGAYLLSLNREKQKAVFRQKAFRAVLLIAAAFFALKIVHWQLPGYIFKDHPYPWNLYWATILQLPIKLLLLLLLLGIIWKYRYANGPFFGFTTKNFNARPYFLMLLCTVPLIAFASTQADFLHMYPKVKNIYFISGYTRLLWPWKLLYEVSYGLDFVSIELFFRGFLVLGLVRFVGVDAILPMAAFYCSIHFGKPPAECISSYLGGLILGVVAYRTKTVLGGLIVHLGLAWMMEIGGYAGLLYMNSR
jgi:hypothetical protein